MKVCAVGIVHSKDSIMTVADFCQSFHVVHISKIIGACDIYSRCSPLLFRKDPVKSLRLHMACAERVFFSFVIQPSDVSICQSSTVYECLVDIAGGYEQRPFF